MAEIKPDSTPESAGTTNAAEVIPPVEAAAHVNAPRTRSKKTPAPAEPVALVEPSDTAVVEPVAVVEPTPVVEPVDTTAVETPAVDTTASDTPVVETKYPVTAPVATAAPVVVAEPAPADVPVTYDPITSASEPETIALAETTPVDHPVQEVVIVDAPVPPKKRTNRLAGLLYSLLATIVFTALFAAAVILIGLIAEGTVSLAFLTEPSFYFPSLLFFLALLIVTAVVNNAGWWTYIITSVLVGAAVYFGTAGILLLSAGVFDMTRQEANTFYFTALINPLTIAAALIAREVAIWTGAILGARGRKVRVRNVEAREAYEREQAELTPTATV